MYFTQIKSYWLNNINIFMEKYDLKWSKLGTLGHNSIIKSSYIWLVIVPLAAKIVLALNKIPFIFEYIKHFTLPFSWVLFYFMALCFAIGQVIYNWKCPDILKNYANFSDYEKSGGSNLLILNWLEQFLITSNEGNLNTFINVIENLPKEIFSKINTDKLTYIVDRKEMPSTFMSMTPKEVILHILSAYRFLIKTNPIPIEKQNRILIYKDYINCINEICINLLYQSNEKFSNELFYVISNAYEQVNQNYLKASVICFGLGFFFFTIIAIQNLLFVITTTF